MWPARKLFVFGLIIVACFHLVAPLGLEPLVADTPEKTLPESEESLAGYGLLLLIMVLMISFIIGHLLHQAHFEYLHESGAAMITGLVTGLVIKLLTNADALQQVVKFDQHFFFLVLLPPIIFESGYKIRKGHFFFNFDSILMYALIGTTISMFVTGIIVYVFAGKLGWTANVLTGLDAMFIGAILSATDPVTVLSLFKELGVSPPLFANVFGESVLNDAVAIVLYRTLEGFVHSELTIGTLLLAVLSFFKILIGSFLVAFIVASAAALLFKHTNLREQPQIESALLILYAYISYLLAEDLHLSGIVAILFCGIIMSHYAYNNLSKTSQRITTRFFEIVPLVFETFVFVYLGMILFTFNQEYDFGLVLFTLPALLISRALNIFPLSWIVNQWRSKEHQVPMNEQIMLWFSGLRGAIAVALSLNVPSFNSQVILSNTLMIVFFTVLIMGGMTIPMLKWLKVWYKASGEVGNQPDDIDFDSLEGVRSNKIFLFDLYYLRPFFLRHDDDKGHGGHGAGLGGLEDGSSGSGSPQASPKHSPKAPKRRSPPQKRAQEAPEVIVDSHDQHSDDEAAPWNDRPTGTRQDDHFQPIDDFSDDDQPAPHPSQPEPGFQSIHDLAQPHAAAAVEPAPVAATPEIQEPQDEVGLDIIDDDDEPAGGQPPQGHQLELA